YVSLTAKDAYDVEYWPLELYKLTLAPPEKEQARRIVLVTGGGSGIGRAVAKRLAAEGAHVVVGDLDEAGARKTAEEVTAAARGDARSDLPGPGRRARLRRHQERDVAGQGLRRVFGGEGGRGPAREGAGARGRAARHPLEHREPGRRLPGQQALVGGRAPRARRCPGHHGRAARGLLPQAQPARRPHPAGGRRRGRAVPRLRPRVQDDRLHAHRGRRRQGRLSAVSAGTLRFGVQLSLKPPQEQFDLVRRIEALGFDSVWTGDHVSFHNPMYESLTLLAGYVP